jgi:glycosyltransferase involved in cell wall biosynthesis
MSVRISDSAPLLPVKKAKDILPDIVVALMLDAQVIEKYRDGDGVGVWLGDEFWHLAAQDYRLAKKISKELKAELNIGCMANAVDVLKIRRHAFKKIEKEITNEPLNSVAMLKDKGSSGWWRMVMPSRMMEKEGWQFDCTAAPVDFDHLLEYDTIFVQRIHDWESFYMLEKLKKAGKRIVYDIDDDLFNITPDNPAYHSITRDDQLAAANCMKLADAITVTTAELSRRLRSVVEGIVEPTVIPNAWDVSDRWSEQIGSPDNIKRILWSGGASHGKDWEECFEAVSEVMQERDDVRLVILGYLPPCIEKSVNLAQFVNRIEFCGFREPDTYYEMAHHVRAEVGLAPIQSTSFNAAKSSIKFLEYSLMGIPTIASDWLPYNADIEDHVNGLLVKSKDQWKSCIEYLLDNPEEREKMVHAARHFCAEYFDLEDAVDDWLEVLCGD